MSHSIGMEELQKTRQIIDIF